MGAKSGEKKGDVDNTLGLWGHNGTFLAVMLKADLGIGKKRSS